MDTRALGSPTSTDELVSRFLDGTLPRAAWTHPAHLVVCHHLLETMTPDAVLAELRVRIAGHNARVGVRSGHGGYHETITRYFVGAVAAAVREGARADDLLTDARCQRDAPQRHWSPDALGSPEARQRWIPPDRDPVPWPATT